MQNKHITLVVPVYNESKNLHPMLAKLQEVTSRLKQYNFSFLFVNDGSRDETQSILEELAGSEPRLHYIEFSRNFGKEIASSAGLWHADGDAVILMDGDLQHPPDLIPEFLAKWEGGAEVVVGVRDENEGHSWLRKLGSKIYYSILEWISEQDSFKYSTDFRLLDRKVIMAFRNLPEKQRLTRGLIDWLGFRRDKIIYQADKRNAGDVQYNYVKLIRLAFHSFTSQSLIPLKIAGYLGAVITVFSGSVGFFVLVNQFILQNNSGFILSYIAILGILNMFLVGIVLSCLGFVALYIGNIHTEVLGRPLFVIRQENLSPPKPTKKR